MDGSELLRAVALVMVIEGLLPFAAPARWRQMMLSVMELDSRNIRVVGLLSMLAGLVMLKLA